MKRATAAACLVGVAACSEGGTLLPRGGESVHSSSIEVSADGATVYVVNPDADSLSVLDTRSGTLRREVLLSGSHPAPDAHGVFYPAVEPRALAFAPGQATLYVSGHRSGRVYAVDPVRGTVLRSAHVCSEPVGVLVSPLGESLYVACSQDDAVIRVDAASLAVTGEVSCDRKPWTLAWSEDRSVFYATHLLGPGVSVLTPAPFAMSGVWTLQDGPRRGAATVPHGPVRGVYDAVARPGTHEVWTAHMMLGIDTPQPALAFNSTAFPAVTILGDGGRQLARLTVTTEPDDGAAIADVVSGPRALAFSPDGALAFMADAASEDVLVIDAERHVESPLGLVRPLPGHQPEGLVVAGDGSVYVDERNTSDVAVLKVASGPLGPSVTALARIPRLTRDPMPAKLRRGQHLFNSADSDELPLTTDHWVSCASCHIEQRSDAVTWLFKQGPRDTPSNAGGVRHTGFLLRTAARRSVQDYWQTINAEQGGHFSTTVPSLSRDLDALADYVNLAIPYPSPPSALDPGAVTRGRKLFGELPCPGCHSGDFFTDSGQGNPALDLDGPVILHDVGTCVTRGPFNDQAVPDEDGHPRAACSFDTPTLRGVADTAPYLHDGSAATLEDVFRLAPQMVGEAATRLSAEDRADLIAYLRSL